MNDDRLLENRVALIHGGGGAIGGAIARAFARQGAKVFLAGRTPSKLEAVVKDIAASGGVAESAQVDALDGRAVTSHADAVAAKAGRIDVALNAVGIPNVQGVRFAELAVEDFVLPIAAYMRTNFITAQAAARHMLRARRGVVLTLSTPGSRMVGTGFLPYGVTCAAVEAFSRLLAADLGPGGIRVNCLCSHAIPEAAQRGSHSKDVFRPVAESAGITVEAMLAGAAEATLLKRLPTLDQVANTAAFLASDHAAAMTGAIANLSCGTLVD
jgi:3-oxoacyl-[acyl-carrier protein] reductase